MSFTSIKALLIAAENSGKPLYEVIREADCEENGYTAEYSDKKMHTLWSAMKESSAGYNAADRSNSRLSGGDAELLRQAASSGLLLGGEFFVRVIEEAVKAAECNACMKRIVAAPTAGSCGVLPAVLIAYSEFNNTPDSRIIEALYVAAAFGEITALKACVSGAEGGCQAEIGAASAMAAAALTYLMGGAAEMSAHAFAIALSNLLGLVCDPVAGLVEIPCIKRNAVGAVNALAAANMAIAGIESLIPADEVIEAMGEIGHALPSSLRETAQGGLAATETAKRITAELGHVL